MRAGSRHLPILPRHRTAHPSPSLRNGWTMFISDSRETGSTRARGRLSPSPPENTIIIRMRVKIKKSQGSARAYRATSQALWVARWPAGHLLWQPQVAGVTSRCSAPFAVPCLPSLRGLGYLLSARTEGNRRARAEEASPRPGHTGRRGGAEGREGSGKESSPGRSPRPPGRRRARPGPLLCIRKTEPRRRAEELRAPLVAGARLFLGFCL